MRLALDRRRFLCALAAALPLSRGARAQSAAERLIAAMQDGGKVIYLRHAATNQDEGRVACATRLDSAAWRSACADRTGRLGDRGGQRNLSQAGIRQARDLGRALRALRVPLNEILASPVFRARDTAELAFGEHRIKVTMDLVADEYAGSQVRAMIEATRRLLRTPPGPGMNRVLVGHRTPLEMATERRFPDEVLPEGAMAVFLPGGSPVLLGTISTERVMASAEARGALAW